MKIIKVVGYARKSPDDKEDTDRSIDNQSELIKKTCIDKSNEEETWELQKIFIDRNLSGGDRFRKGFTDMVDYSIKNGIEILVTKEQNRVARDSSFFLDTLKDLEVIGIKIYSIMKGDFLSSDDIGDAIMSVVGGHYIVEQRKKAILAQDQKREKNLPSIPAPFGYEYDKDKNWVIDKKNADIVRQISSDLKKNISYKDTIKRIKITKSAYYRIINNIKKGIYSGWIIYNKKFKNSDKVVVRMEEVKYKGSHEPILPIDVSDTIASNIIENSSKEDINKMKDRVRDTRLNRFSMGIIVARPPVGYLPIFDNKRRHRGIIGIKIDKKKAEMIKSIFELTSQGNGYKMICDKWKIKPQTYYNIIKNKVYIGIVEFEGNEIKGSHSPIISPELFQKCQKN